MVLRDVERRSSEGRMSAERYVQDFLPHIKRTNKGYYEGALGIVIQMTKTMKFSETELASIVMGFHIGYELLRRQGEAYKLDDSVK